MMGIGNRLLQFCSCYLKIQERIVLLLAQLAHPTAGLPLEQTIPKQVEKMLGRKGVTSWWAMDSK
jgi:hypothetical protein